MRELLEGPTRAAHQYAVRIAPRRTGRYADTINHHFRLGYPDRGGRLRSIGVVEATVSYSTIVEWGSKQRNHAARDVLLNALQSISTSPGRQRG